MSEEGQIEYSFCGEEEGAKVIQGFVNAPDAILKKGGLR